MVRPGTGSAAFEDLFDLEEIQRLQDSFASATGVASLFTRPDGRELTRPSNFCRFCTLVRNTPRGLADCEAFSRSLSGLSLEGPTLLTCLAGLPCVAAPVCADGQQLGTWRIEQVRTATTPVEPMLEYARAVGLDEAVAREAIAEIPPMPEERFRAIGDYLFQNARLLSRLALTTERSSREALAHRDKLDELRDERRLLQGILSESRRMENALRESEARFRNIVQRSPMGMYLYELRPDGRLILIDANESADRFTGVDTDRLFGLTIEEAFPGLAATEIPDRFRAAAREGHSWELRDLAYDDERIHGRFDVYAFQTSPGRMAVMFLDVTERHRAQEAIRETQERISGLFRAMPCAVGTLRDRTLSSVNERSATMLGYSADELVGRHVRTLYETDEEYERVGQVLYGNTETAVRAAETRWLHRDGHLVEVVVSVTRVHPGDESSEFIFAALDVTERNRAERQFDRFFNLSTDLLCIAGFDGRLRFVNPAWTRVLGWTAEELAAAPWLDFVHPDDREATLAAGERLVSGNTVLQFENRYLTRDGSYRWLSWDSFPLREEQTIFAVVRDVTEQRLAEDEKKRLEAQLRQSQKMEAVGQLAGGVAHDFNNLLQVIVGYTDVALAGLDRTHPSAGALQEVSQASERATTLTRQLLAFSRRDSHQPRCLDLNPLIENLVRMLKRLIGEDVELELRMARGIPQVLADPGQLEQVLLNLCINARDAMPNGGRLVITTAADGPGFVVLEVSDTGHGIPPEIRERIFEPFYTTKPVGEGTGLGLATVYAIVARHGGDVHVESEPGRGATFRVRLPVAPAEVAPPDAADGALQITGGTETILLAEDDEAVRNLALAMLGNAGYRTLVARDGLEATELLAHHADEIQLAVLDVVMPRRSGREVLAEIRRRRPDLPVILTSGYSYAAGAPQLSDDRTLLMQKPYTTREILCALRAMLEPVNR